MGSSNLLSAALHLQSVVMTIPYHISSTTSTSRLPRHRSTTLRILHVSKNVSGHKKLILLYGNGSEILNDIPIIIELLSVKLNADLFISMLKPSVLQPIVHLS